MLWIAWSINKIGGKIEVGTNCTSRQIKVACVVFIHHHHGLTFAALWKGYGILRLGVC